MQPDEDGARWLDAWLRAEIAAIRPSLEVHYGGATSAGSHYWQIGDERPFWLAVTGPGALEPFVREVPRALNQVDWFAWLERLEPEGEGLLVAAGGQLFAWDPERDRGTRLIQPDD